MSHFYIFGMLLNGWFPPLVNFLKFPEGQINRECHKTGNYHARIQGFFLGDRDPPPPLRLSAIFFCLLICPGPCNNLDPLLKFLYETSPSDVRTPPPPLLNPGSAPDYHTNKLYEGEIRDVCWVGVAAGLYSDYSTFTHLSPPGVKAYRWA